MSRFALLSKRVPFIVLLLALAFASLPAFLGDGGPVQAASACH